MSSIPCRTERGREKWSTGVSDCDNTDWSKHLDASVSLVVPGCPAATAPCPRCHSCGTPGWPAPLPYGPDKLCLTLSSLRYYPQTYIDPRLHGTWTGTHKQIWQVNKSTSGNRYLSQSMSDLLSMSAWLSCLLSSAGETDDVLLDSLRNECVLRDTSLVLPLAVWHVSSPLYKSKGFWEKRSGLLPTSTTRGPCQTEGQRWKLISFI